MLHKNLLRFVLLAFFVIALGACSKDGDNDVTEPPIGPIPAKEFKSVPSPTFKTVIKAFEEVTTANPALLQDELLLARALFDWVKAHPNGRLFDATGTQETQFFDLLTRLTWEEWKVIILNPIDGYNASGTVDPSKKVAQAKYPCDSDVGFEDGKADALRHAYWNALMVRRTNVEFAEDFSTAHESGSTKKSATAMDLHNNKIGRDLAMEYPTATEDQLLELLLQKKFFYLENPNDPIPEEAKDALVYFAAKRPFDGTFTGTLTNPDSGGPWNATFDINQCGNIVRGQFTITRGTALQKRRFNGTLNPNGSVSLVVSDPYVFENPGGLSFCTNMLMTLTGNQNSLQGNWTASNCGLGGTVDIQK